MHCLKDGILFFSNWPAFDSVKYAHKTKVLGRTIKRREILFYIFLWLCQLNCGYLLGLNRRTKNDKEILNGGSFNNTQLLSTFMEIVTFIFVLVIKLLIFKRPQLRMIWNTTEKGTRK